MAALRSIRSPSKKRTMPMPHATRVTRWGLGPIGEAFDIAPALAPSITGRNGTSLGSLVAHLNEHPARPQLVRKP